MQITVNGDDREVADSITVAALVEVLGFGDRRVAVEVNQEIVPRSTHAEYRLCAGDRIELVHAMGGG